MLETFSGFVRRVVRALNRSRLQYMLTGALASSYYDREDIKVILETMQISMKTLRRRARAESTVKILDDLIA